MRVRTRTSTYLAHITTPRRLLDVVNAVVPAFAEYHSQVQHLDDNLAQKPYVFMLEFRIQRKYHNSQFVYNAAKILMVVKHHIIMHVHVCTRMSQAGSGRVGSCPLSLWVAKSFHFDP